mmetsp:Transcript_16308/g.22471  ORF Transcript_16308/g.22471 Transcript_16308/m.22471 type:complete len:327 (-) Transcript_16308:120-1100(-)
MADSRSLMACWMRSGPPNASRQSALRRKALRYEGLKPTATLQSRTASSSRSSRCLAVARFRCSRLQMVRRPWASTSAWVQRSSASAKRPALKCASPPFFWSSNALTDLNTARRSELSGSERTACCRCLTAFSRSPISRKHRARSRNSSTSPLDAVFIIEFDRLYASSTLLSSSRASKRNRLTSRLLLPAPMARASSSDLLRARRNFLSFINCFASDNCNIALLSASFSIKAVPLFGSSAKPIFKTRTASSNLPRPFKDVALRKWAFEFELSNDIAFSQSERASRYCNSINNAAARFNNKEADVTAETDSILSSSCIDLEYESTAAL